MEKHKDAWNIIPLKLTVPEKKRMKEVSVVEIFEPSTSNFHTQGIYSTEVFGPIGSEERNSTMAYIPLYTTVINPKIYILIISLNSLYENIIKSRKFARFDEEKEDFVLADISTGETGYDFFFSYVEKIKFKRNKSLRRDNAIDAVERSIKDDTWRLTEFVILPAGMRDFTVKDNGDVSEDEINDFYKKIIGNTTLLKSTHSNQVSISLLNPVRSKLQDNIVEVFKYIMNDILGGKGGFIQNKWTKRAVTHGTRNVITAVPEKIDSLDDFEHSPTVNDTIIGVYQLANMYQPLIKFGFKSTVLDKIHDPSIYKIKLPDPKTFEPIFREISESEFNRLTTEAGLEMMIKKLGSHNAEKDEFLVDELPLCLIYDDGKTVFIVTDKNSLSEDRDQKYLRPIKYGELFYLILMEFVFGKKSTITRFPVTGEGSIYATRIYIKSTFKGEKREVISNITGETFVVHEFPSKNEPYFKSMSPHWSRLGRMGADFDGDQSNANPIFTDEADEEIDKLMKSRNFYININGELTHNPVDDVARNTIKSIKRGNK